MKRVLADRRAMIKARTLISLFIVAMVLVRSGQFRIIEAAGHNRVGVAILAAFAGALVGTPLMEKVTMRFVQATVGIMLLLVAGGLMAGLI